VLTFLQVTVEPCVTVTAAGAKEESSISTTVAPAAGAAEPEGVEDVEDGVEPEEPDPDRLELEAPEPVLPAGAAPPPEAGPAVVLTRTLPVICGCRVQT
jgi:hypothetical protein